MRTPNQVYDGDGNRDSYGRPQLTERTLRIAAEGERKRKCKERERIRQQAVFGKGKE